MIFINKEKDVFGGIKIYFEAFSLNLLCFYSSFDSVLFISSTMILSGSHTLHEYMEFRYRNGSVFDRG